MSAFVVDRDVIRYLVTAATALQPRDCIRWYWSDGTFELHGGDYERATAVGNMLWQENLRSVRHRYPNEPDSELPGPCDETFVYDHSAWTETLIEPVQVLKAIACLRYQACEHPEWEASEAFAFLRSLEQAAIACLPGYERAAWGAPN